MSMIVGMLHILVGVHQSGNSWLVISLSADMILVVYDIKYAKILFRFYN